MGVDVVLVWFNFDVVVLCSFVVGVDFGSFVKVVDCVVCLLLVVSV